MSTKISIGIDPGKRGALAIIYTFDDNKVKVEIHPYDPLKYQAALAACQGHISQCCLERVGAMPGQGVKSMFSFGENYGFAQGLLTAYHISFETVPPRKWKAEYSLGNDKSASIETAKRLFPEVSLRPTERSIKDSDGMAEALLMAEYARRHL